MNCPYVPALLAFGDVVVGGHKIAAHPGCDPQQRRCRSAHQMVVLRDELERAPGAETRGQLRRPDTRRNPRVCR